MRRMFAAGPLVVAKSALKRRRQILGSYKVIRLPVWKYESSRDLATRAVAGGDTMKELYSSLPNMEALETMESIIFNDSNDHEAWALLLDAYSTYHPNGPEALRTLQAWNEVHAGNMEKCPTRDHYHSVLRAYAYGDVKDAVEGGEVAQEILTQLNMWGSTMNPDLETVSLVMHCVARSSNYQPDSKLKKVLYEQNLAKLLEAVDAISRADVRVVFEVVNALTAMFECILADKVLDDPAFSLLSSSWPQLASLWASLIRSLIEAKGDTPATRKQLREQTLVLLRMYADAKTPPSSTIESVDDLVSLTGNFQHNISPEHIVWAIKASKKCEPTIDHYDDRIKRWLQNMNESHERWTANEMKGEVPALISKRWNDVMIAHYEAENIDQVKTIWKQMKQAKDVYANRQSYNIVLRALASGSIRDAEQAHSIWRKMVSVSKDDRKVTPSTYHYGIVMASWARTRDERAPKMCALILNTLKKNLKTEENLSVTIAHYNTLLSTYRWKLDDTDKTQVFNVVKEMLASGLDLDFLCYSNMIAALVRCQNDESVKLAAELFDEAHEMLDLSISDSYKLHGLMMRGWADSKVPGAADRCLELYNRLNERCRSDESDGALQSEGRMIRSVVQSLLSSGKVEQVGQAEEILELVEKSASNDVDRRLDRGTYMLLIDYYATAKRVDSVLRVKDLIGRMALFHQQGHHTLKPAADVYGALMGAIANNDSDTKVTEAHNVFLKMVAAYNRGDESMRPNTRAFVAMINACAYSRRPSPSTLQIAIDTLRDMDTLCYHGRCEPAYRYALLTLSRHSRDEKIIPLTSDVLGLCCKEGHLSQHILTNVRRQFPELYKQTLQSKLNPDWSRKLPERMKPQQV